MKLFVILSFLIFNSSLSYAEELALSKEEVMSRIDQNSLNFNKSFVLPLTDQKDGKKINIPQNMLVERLLKSNPTLKEEYLYYNYFRTNKWEYTVNYEWYSHKCKLRISEFTKEGKGINYKVSDSNAREMMINGTEIPLKYCEKVYGIKIK